MPYAVTEACVDVKDRSCVRSCPVDCIYEGDRQMYIHPAECIDCGACEEACPVEAVVWEDDLPPDLATQAARNAEVFVPLGLLGGARKYGPLGLDHPDVVALPSRVSG